MLSTEENSLTFMATVRDVSSLFNTSFSQYDTGNEKMIRAMHYYLPDAVSDHVDTVSGILAWSAGQGVADSHRDRTWPREAEMGPQTRGGNHAEDTLTPSRLRQIYHTEQYDASSSSGSRVAWAAFFDGSAMFTDIEKYEDFYNLPRRNFTIDYVDGARPNQEMRRPTSHRTDLDAFNILALTKGQLPLVQYSVGGRSKYIPDAASVGPAGEDANNEPYLALFEHMLAQDDGNRAQVISLSYSDDEQTVPRKYAERVCETVGMLALRGVTVIQTMAGRGPGTACVSNDGEGRSEFTPQFPASCPYVTGVGEVNQTDPLVTWNISSGGFSNYFARPGYQEEAVTAYLTNFVSAGVLEYYEPMFNKHGRASPDVALLGYKPDTQGDFSTASIAPSDGTRGNAAFAGLVGLLNDARMRAGQPTMGFINPWLYGIGHRGLVDVVLGGSVGCVGENIQFHRPLPHARKIPWVSWNATEGWDPATGLGFPDFAKLLPLAMQPRATPDACPYDWWKIGL